jgi:acetyltransferase EpsM
MKYTEDNSKKIIAIVGGSAGSLIAKSIYENSYNYSEIVFVESYAKNLVSKFEKITDAIDFLKKDNVDYFIATGDNNQRKENYLLIKGFTKKEPTNCIHSRASIASDSKLGFGNLICSNSVININAIIGNCAIVNTGAIVEHDCVVEDFAQLSPNSTLCGYVHIKESSFVGASSVIIPNIIVNANSVIAAGSSVIKNVEEKTLVAGIPAKFKKYL